MTTPRRTDRAQLWLWGTCVVAFLAGIYVAWLHIGEAPLAPGGVADIESAGLDRLLLKNPFPARPEPPEAPGTLRFGLYRSDPAQEEKPLAEAVHPVAFILSDPWVEAWLKEKLPNPAHSFAFRMRGQISLSAPISHLHVRSDNGFRITFRDAQGHEEHLLAWEDNVTENFYLKVVATPGCYDLTIDFFNVQGNAYFDLWSEQKDIRFYPADSIVDPPKASP